VGHLVRWFPGAKVLYLARHPIDVVTSFWRRAQDDPQAAGWAAVDVDSFVQRYRRNVALAQGWAERRPGQVRLLRYEDLVDDPDGVLEALLQFVDAPFAPDAVTGEDRVGDQGDRYVWGDVRRQTKDWQEFIDLVTAVDIERRLESTMARLGYTPHAALG